MKLKCTIGSINFVCGKAVKSVSRGDIFDAEEAEAKTLIAHGYAVEESVPTKARPTKPAK